MDFETNADDAGGARIVTELPERTMMMVTAPAATARCTTASAAMNTRALGTINSYKGRPRSLGCSTCRQRRVKCDETYPTCTRCAKLSLPCTGPIPRGSRWIDTQTDAPPAGSSAEYAPAPASAPLPETHSNSTTLVENRAATARSNVVGWRVWNGPHQRPAVKRRATVSVPPVPSRTGTVLGIEILLFARSQTFRDSSFPNWKLKDMLQRGVVSASSLPLFSRHDVAGAVVSLSDRAYLAIALCAFGTRRQHHDVRRQGSEMYTTVLRDLRCVLDCEEAQKTDVLSVVMGCFLFELLCPIAKGSVSLHFSWLERLLLLGGPNAIVAFRKKLVILHYIRLITAISASILRRTSPLLSDEWTTLPWKKVTKPPLQYLLETINEITRLRVERDEFLETEVCNTTKRVGFREMLHKAEKILAELYAWRETWYCVRDKSEEPDRDPALCATGAHVPGWEAKYAPEGADSNPAVDIATYSAAILMILSIIMSVRDMLHGPSIGAHHACDILERAIPAPRHEIGPQSAPSHAHSLQEMREATSDILWVLYSQISQLQTGEILFVSVWALSAAQWSLRPFGTLAPVLDQNPHTKLLKERAMFYRQEYRVRLLLDILEHPETVHPWWRSYAST